MKKLHVIKSKALNNLTASHRKQIFKILEKETLVWSKKNLKEAYKATLGVKEEFKKNPDEFKNKYFKYLRRLFELKLKYLEDEAYRNNIDGPKVPDEIRDILNVESLRIPQYISCSQLEMYESCPRKWFYRYALGIKFPKTTALHFGSAVDEALNFYFEEKIAGRLPSRSAVHASFFENFDKDSDDVRWGEDDPKQLRKNGPIIIDKYIDSFDRVTNATGVQIEIRVPLENGDGYLFGFIDILEEDAVVDTKTAKKRWDENSQFAKHKKGLQHKAYSLWFLEHFERMPKEFRYQIVTKEVDENGVATPDTQLIPVEVKKFELERFRRRVQGVWDDIKEQLPKGMKAFPAQAEPGPGYGRGLGKQDPGVLCCSTWCDYADICRANGLKIPTRWVKKTKDAPGHHVYD
jgi:hypothetical protein